MPFKFADPASYEKTREVDSISLPDILDIDPGASVTATINHADGSEKKIELRHTMNADQIAWFKAGSALNLLRKRGD